MSVIVIREENGVAKLRTQGAKDHEFVINIRPQEANRANSHTVLFLPAQIVSFHLTRQPTQVIRLIQSFCCFGCDRVGSELRFLRLVVLTLFGLITRQSPVDSAQITIWVHPRRPLVRLLNELTNGSAGSQRRKDRAQRLPVRGIPFCQNYGMRHLRNRLSVGSCLLYHWI